MQLSSLALLAASISTAAGASGTGSDWVTYTKKLATTTVVVTRYLGSSSVLTGTEYTTRTITVSSDGSALYTEIITNFAQSNSSSSSTVAASSSAGDSSSSGSGDSSSSADSSSSSSGSDSSSSSAESSSSSGAAATAFGISAGALVLAGAALL